MVWKKNKIIIQYALSLIGFNIFEFKLLFIKIKKHNNTKYVFFYTRYSFIKLCTNIYIYVFINVYAIECAKMFYFLHLLSILNSYEFI